MSKAFVCSCIIIGKIINNDIYIYLFFSFQCYDKYFFISYVFIDAKIYLVYSKYLATHRDISQSENINKMTFTKYSLNTYNKTM